MESFRTAALELAAERLLQARARTVLLVEDNAAHAALLRRAFDPGLWEVEHVTRASAALFALSGASDRIVVLDLTLPDSDGLALLDKIHSLNTRAAVIIVTSLEDVSTCAEAMKRGAWDYVVKGDPQATMAQVRAAVERAWEKRFVRAQEELIAQTKIVELVRAERLEAIELVVRTVCHEVNNPLSGVLALSQLLGEKVGAEEDLKRLVDTILASAREVARVVQKLHGISDTVTEFGGVKVLQVEGPDKA